MTVSWPIWTLASMNVLAGSVMVTPLEHQPFQNAATHQAFGLGKLHPIIHAHHFLQRRADGGDGMALSGSHLHQVDEIILVADGVALHMRQVFPKPISTDAIHRGVYFGDGALLGVGVLLLDNRAHVPALIAHNAPIASRVGGLGGEKGERASAPLRRFEQRPQRVSSSAAGRRLAG